MKLRSCWLVKLRAETRAARLLVGPWDAVHDVSDDPQAVETSRKSLHAKLVRDVLSNDARVHDADLVDAAGRAHRVHRVLGVCDQPLRVLDRNLAVALVRLCDPDERQPADVARLHGTEARAGLEQLRRAACKPAGRRPSRHCGKPQLEPDDAGSAAAEQQVVHHGAVEQAEADGIGLVGKPENRMVGVARSDVVRKRVVRPLEQQDDWRRIGALAASIALHKIFRLKPSKRPEPQDAQTIY